MIQQQIFKQIHSSHAKFYSCFSYVLHVETVPGFLDKTKGEEDAIFY
jgi:hypothetical protein